MRANPIVSSLYGLAVVMVAAVTTTSLQAQVAQRTPVVFLEKAYFSLGTPSKKSLLFEGQPTVHYFMRNRLADETWQRDGGWQWTLPVSALFQVRMTDTISEPVRSPSYRIRPLYAQLLRLFRPSNRMEYRLLGLSGGFAHYSNGQAGCTYRGFARSDDGSCRVADATLAGRRIANTLDGDFSTSYWSVAAHWRQGWLLASDHPMRRQYTLQAEVQLHPYDTRPGGMNREQAETFGQHQWSVNGEVEQRVGMPNALKRLLGPGAVTRAALLYEQRVGGPNAVRLGRWQGELSAVADSVENLGVFIRVHRGFDYYNIQYQNTQSFIAVGIMWDIGRLDKLTTRAPD